MFSIAINVDVDQDRNTEERFVDVNEDACMGTCVGLLLRD